MFSVNGHPIFENELTVLEELRRQLMERDIEIFRVLKPTGNNIMTTCPFHKQGRERKPSFGISTQSEMKCHCFSCGWAGTVDVLISNLLGYVADGGQAGREWLSSNFVTTAIENRRPLDLSIMSRDKTKAVKQTYISEEYLATLRYIHPYMYERGLTDELIELFDVGYDGASECITFPVLDINKNCVFVAGRSVRTKFFSLPLGVEKPVYGAYLIMEGNYTSIAVVESIINAITCWKYGLPAVALIGTGSEAQYEILRRLPVRKLILGLDPDLAGRKGTQRLRDALSDCKIITELDIPRDCDINDLQEKLLELHEFF